MNNLRAFQQMAATPTRTVNCEAAARGSCPPLILHIFPSFGIGGAQMRFVTLATHFGRNYRHAVVSMSGDQQANGLLPPDLEVTYPAISGRKGETIANVRHFRRVLRALAPDVLVTHNWGSIEWAMANAVPIVRHIHIEDGFGREEQDCQITRRVLTRRIFLRQSTVVLPSRCLHRIATDVWRLPRRRVHYIPNGVALRAFTVKQDPSAIPARQTVIGTVAGLRAEKNVARLMQAFALVAAEHPAKLVIAGDGPERAELERIAAQLGVADKVCFLGHVKQPQHLYAGFDIFALSSDTEQMPLCILEAMAAGLPIVSTDVGDVAEMVAPENRLHIRPREPAALAGSMLQLLREPTARQHLGTANRRKVEREYSQEAMFQAYAALFSGTPRESKAA